MPYTVERDNGEVLANCRYWIAALLLARAHGAGTRVVLGEEVIYTMTENVDAWSSPVGDKTLGEAMFGTDLKLAFTPPVEEVEE